MGVRRVWALLGLSALAVLPGLGGSSRLTYHEAFVAQGAREMLASGDWAHPTIGGRPWLEKPPLPWWLAAGLGRLAGGVDETIARLPSAAAAMLLALGVAVLATRRFGPTVGWASGALQATTFWTFQRGRLAEPDVLLASIVAWALVAFDRLSGSARRPEANGIDPPVSPLRKGGASKRRYAFPFLSPTKREGEGSLREASAREGEPCSPLTKGGHRGVLRPGSAVFESVAGARWAFFALLGASAWAKGVGFGAVQIGAIVLVVLVWRRDRATARRLAFFAPGWALAAALALAWPAWMIARHGPGALALWSRHVAERFAARPVEFAGEPWSEYLPGLLFQALPWAPLALFGAVRSLRRAFRPDGNEERADGDRLLWAWSAAPLALLALATVRNAHYAVAAQAPWSIWAALVLVDWAERRDARLGRPPGSMERRRALGLAALALMIGLGFQAVGPRVGPRGAEPDFYRAAGRLVPADAPLALLYDDWDRKPYFTPFGAFPHDVALRLFYLERPAVWRWDPSSATAPAGPPTLGPVLAVEIYVIGRERDRPLLEKLGRVEAIARARATRWDRSYVLFRVGRPLATRSLKCQAVVEKEGAP